MAFLLGKYLHLVSSLAHTSSTESLGKLIHLRFTVLLALGKRLGNLPDVLQE